MADTVFSLKPYLHWERVIAKYKGQNIGFICLDSLDGTTTNRNVVALPKEPRQVQPRLKALVLCIDKE